jgi:peptidoglycan/xylan/chitin deacetylase (PgdA/CDA1 family)
VVAGPRTGHQVSLTFHLSGDPALVAQLLDTAAHAGVPISLFAVGRWLTEHPVLVRRILADGHELDNHTWSHPLLGRLDRVAVAIEIRRCKAALTQATGSGGRYFRPSARPAPPRSSWPRPARPATRGSSPSMSTRATTPTQVPTRSRPGSRPACDPARS